MPGKLAAGEQLRSQRSKKSRGNLIENNADAVGGPQICLIRGEYRGVGLVYAERDGVGVRGRLHPGQLLNDFQRLTLEGTAAFFGISSKTQLECRRGNALGLEAEVHLQGLLETTQGKERGRDEYK